MDIFESHGYKPGQELLIDAEFLIGVLSFCRRIDDTQPKIAVPLQYPKEVREITDKESGELQRVDIDWQEHTPKSFAGTAFEGNGAVPILTDLGMLSFQIQQALYKYHQNNIQQGVALQLQQDEQ